MPSPFSGMDPYPERSDWFPGLHDSLIVFIKGLLQQSLPEPYYAESSQRVWLEYSRRCFETDVEVIRSGRKTRARRGGRGRTAVAEHRSADPFVVSVETVEHGPFDETFVEIRRRKGKEVRLVTAIEVLSLSNKTADNPGREKYLTKQREVLDGQVNLVEIDLLRDGTHTTAVPRDSPGTRSEHSITMCRLTDSTGPRIFLSTRLSLGPTSHDCHPTSSG